MQFISLIWKYHINDLLYVMHVQQSKRVFFSHSITQILRQTLTSLSMVIHHALQKLPLKFLRNGSIGTSSFKIPISSFQSAFFHGDLV